MMPFIVHEDQPVIFDDKPPLYWRPELSLQEEKARERRFDARRAKKYQRMVASATKTAVSD